MNTKYKYRNRAQELERLTNILRNAGIVNVESLTTLLVQTIQSYALQIHIEPLKKHEIELVWMRLID